MWRSCGTVRFQSFGGHIQQFDVALRGLCQHHGLLVAACVVLTYAAGMPASLSASTWSRIREISGEMTMVTPGSSVAGIW